MQKLSLILSMVLLFGIARAQQNPHGEKLAFSCTDCHTTEGWKFSVSTAKFSHDLTKFKLEGQHFYSDCKACHKTLVFSEAKTNCNDCHTDMHNNTVGPNCAECHTPKSWIVENITEIHQRSRFPLLGAHNTADCSACHESASKLEFKQLGVECIDCHNKDYQATTKPNHVQSGISTNCIECHRIDAFEWSASGINHDFFPLTKGHEVEDCAACHKAGVSEPISADCSSCHQNDYNNATNPKHQNPGFSNDCAECHTTEPDWKPAEFKTHDALYFPVYSGSHKGEWDNCAECHTQTGNYNQFSCTDCHEHNKSDMDKEHREENGYSYNSLACYACHPNGRSEGAFDHNSTGFLLKGAHTKTTCLDCHSTGFAGTSALCSSCHTKNYNEAVNPNHKSAGIKTECETCHNENAWIPSIFDHKVTSGFALTGGHSGKQCSECHLGNTTSASSECFSCHQPNYNEAKNHQALNYPRECLQCHTTTTWDNATFDHNKTNFPLTGSHTATECSACHTNGYAGTPTLCNTCHTNDYTNSQNPGHKAAGISVECATCHTTTAWAPSLFDHKVTTGFELTGGHSGKQCSECHLGNTTSASSECFSCHQANYNEAKNHQALNYPRECLQCHTTTTWDNATFDHNKTNFPLTGSHTATECSACHTNGYAGTPTLCNTCHTNDYTNSQNPGHKAAGISTECATCHTTTAWIPSIFDHKVTSGFALTGGHSGKQCSECHLGNTTSANSECFSCHQANYNEAKNHLAQSYPRECLQCHTTTTWDNATFDHNKTNFPLTGSHTATECSACHTNGYKGTPTLCNTCHTSDYTNSQNPGHKAAGISTECATCHTTTAWAPSIFDHKVTTGFELTGGHSGKQCSECHLGNTTSANSECFSCHQPNYNEAKNHLAQSYPRECLQCHTTTTWDNATFDHNKTNFPLTGSHTATECSACHTNGYTGTSMLCNTCHTNDYTNSQNPGHKAAGISTECATCHTTTAWAPSIFDHKVTTGFELTGGHSGKQCSECHLGNTTSANSECFSCHQPNYNEAKNHLAQSYPRECLQCHTTTTWDNATFDHNKTNFPLTGSHTATECSACHTNGYKGTPTLCNTCHTSDYTNSQNPGHKAAGISTECATCHTTTAWAPSIFDHKVTTGFELTGGHSGKQCSECHLGNTTSANSECFSCHQPNYNEAKNHLAQSYPRECLQCHTTTTWDNATFDHNKTNFPLTGSHTATECSACHTNGYKGTPTLCNTCHTSDYTNSQNPGHKAAGISTECATCHTTTAWAPSIFDHKVTTGFELTGGHSGKQCSECHLGNTTSANSECFSCHQPNYNEAKNHLAQSYPRECLQCHTTTTWDNATFDHNKTNFPLTGSHTATECSACHTNGYTGTSMLCNTCHTNDYTNSQNPGHKAAGISTECATCHTTTAWAPSIFDHKVTTGFELTGGHSGKQCSECHLGNTTSANSECFSCHQPNYNEAKNHLAQSYPRECLQCHTTTTWDKATFDHNKTAFPLTGAHKATECSACHTNGYTGTSMLCNTCHTNDYTNSQNPGHKAAGISTECATCHTTTAWAPSIFDHKVTTGFELTGGHSGKQCSECHLGNTTSANSECFSCHQPNYNEAKNHLAQSYPRECLQCHTTTTWDNATFDHNKTNFPLTGSHTATECSACHTNGYKGTPTLCNTCHTNDYTNSQNPGHKAAGISTECATCHTTTAWAPSIFDHKVTTGFELTGGHSGKQCSECHLGNTTSANSECFSCHQPNYNEAKNHLAQSYPRECLQCHTTTTWDNATFDHNKTNFPLTGSHTATECSACHTNGYTGTSMLCNTCHTNDYTNSQNPGHKAAGISTECATCHTTTAWAPSIFDHKVTTGFELTGGHSGKQCSECHLGNTTSANSECFSCHQPNYNEAKNHLAQSYPRECLQCHTTTTWDKATFDHNKTAFPLTGAHKATECSACHTNGYKGTSMLCNSCHNNNYKGAINPNHSSLGISTDCEECHTTKAGWEPALLPNHDDYYALNGAHSKISKECFLCHEGNYNTTKNTCYACHTADYNSTTNPAHATAKFPTDCIACHSETAWSPSTFNHDSQYFPIYSGKHKGEWNSCTECHTVPSNYAVFSCITCHEHNKTSMDDKHKEEKGYVYNSANCLACHPRGTADD